jgi:hypothetical protein
LTRLFSGALELPKIIPTSTVAPYPLSSPSTASGHGGGGTTERTAAKSPLNGDNDTEQPPPKKIKKETGAEDENLRVRPECKRSQPEIKSRIQYALDSDNASASNTPLPHSNPQPSLDQNSARSSPIVIRDDDDEVLVVSASQVSRPEFTALKPRPTYLWYQSRMEIRRSASERRRSSRIVWSS